MNLPTALVLRGLTTLDGLVTGLVAVVIFESVLNGLRSYVLSHTTSRFDGELGARLFRHLVQLPLAYFRARGVGDSVARVRQLKSIRAFLTPMKLAVEDPPALQRRRAQPSAAGGPRDARGAGGVRDQIRMAAVLHERGA